MSIRLGGAQRGGDTFEKESGVMFYFIIILLFIGVFVFLGWRIVVTHLPSEKEPDTYVCPKCNANQCDCYKEDRGV